MSVADETPGVAVSSGVHGKESVVGDIANDVVCATEGCGHMASAHQDLDGGENTGACTMQGCDCSAMTAPDEGASADGEGFTVRNTGDGLALYRGDTYVGAVTPVEGASFAPPPPADDSPDDGGDDAGGGPIPPHQTETSDKSFDPAAHAANLPNDKGALREAHAFAAPDGDAADPATYKLLHHEVGADGSVGAANTNAATNAIAALNDGTSGVPDNDRQAVHDHLAGHLNDAGKDVPPLKDTPADGGTPDTENASTRGGDTMAAADDGTGDAAPVSGDDATPGEPGLPPRQTFSIPVAVLEGVDTGDGRHIRGEALTWRELPIPLMAITKTTWGHDDAELVGRIETMERFDASDLINPKTGEAYGPAADGQPTYGLKGSGTFTSLENADTVADLIGEGFLRGISVDLSDVTSVIELLDEEGEPVADDGDIGIEILFMDGEIRETVVEGRVMGATVCPFPAFEGAYIELGDGTQTSSEQPAEAGVERHAVTIHDTYGDRTGAPSLVASAGPMYPPAEWFADPGFDRLTPLTITEDGRIYGHLAPWNEPHRSYSGQNILPPRSRCDYGQFRLGSIKCEDGSLVPIGQITMGTGHADLNLDRVGALAHYDNTGTAVADVAAGEDAFGIWIAGATRPDLTELDARRLRAAKLSGDWREAGGRLELIAALAVNVPGYPVAQAASGHPVALVAAGALQMDAVARTRTHDLADLLAHKDEILAAAAEGRAARARRVVHGTR